ncbi:MAG: hypothetical protein WCD79_07425 [Chthoniobacteraceae bacterium]
MSANGPRISRFEAVLLTTLFAVLIVLPFCKQMIAPEPDTEAVEGRLPNTRPKLSLKKGLHDFPINFEAYYNDHFGFRSALLRLGGYIGVKYANVSLSPDVIIGKEGWLFLRSGQTLENYRGGPIFSNADLELWKRSLERRQQWLAQRGIKFLFVVAPDKQTVYREFMPDKYSRLHDPTPAQQLVDYLTAHSSVHVLPLLEPLLKAKESGERLYFRHDTHWNTMGAYVGYSEILGRLHEWFPDLKPKDRSKFQVVMNYTKGDLARMMGMPDYSAGNEPTLVPLVATRNSSIPLKVEGEDLDARWNFTTEAPGVANKTRVVMIHDSYTWLLTPFLSADLAQITYLFRFKDDEKFEKTLAKVVQMEKPEVFIEQRVERYLLVPPPDEKIIFGGDGH